MKILAAMLMMGMAVGGWGQNPMAAPTEIAPNVQARGGVLKCGKYQHLVYEECHDVSGMWSCPSDPNAGKCADDMHMVTEREWQSVTHSVDLLRKLNDVQAARLKLLEEQQLDIRAFAQGVIAGATQTRKP